MKRSFFTTAATVCLLALAAEAARAQSAAVLRVNVPFDFGAAESVLPAGEYSVRFVSQRGVLLRSADGRTKVLVQAPLAREGRGRAEARERLVFRRYGDAYFLAQVWAGGGRELYESGAEARLVKRLRGRGAPAAVARTVEVIASRE